MSPGMASDWAGAPPRPAPAAGVVDVWRARLAAPPSWVRDLLSDDELARAERLLRERDRERWAASRAILRALVGRYLGVDGRRVRFALSPQGKPALSAAQLRFNLSHSGELALYAFCGEFEVGVDVEHGGRTRDPLPVARRILGPEEEQRLSALEPAAQHREFLRSWVRHEAIAKCLGSGIGGRQVGAEGVSVMELDVASDAAAAVAVAASEFELRLFEWST